MVAMEHAKRPRRSLPDEYKAQVVELCRSGGRSIAAVARDLDLSETAVRRWVAQAEIEPAARRTDEFRARGARRACAARTGPARGARHPEASDGFLRQRDPVSVYPFIEAEKVAERNVALACVLMEVSRSAFYDWHHHRSSPRADADAKLTEAIVEIHAKSRSTYGSPRVTAAPALRRSESESAASGWRA